MSDVPPDAGYCDCPVFERAHEPAPVCRVGACREPATKIFVHREAPGCWHLACDSCAEKHAGDEDHELFSL